MLLMITALIHKAKPRAKVQSKAPRLQEKSLLKAISW